MVDSQKPSRTKETKARKADGKRPKPLPRHEHLNPKHRFAIVDLAVLPMLTGNALKVYIALVSRADADRGSCFPLKETISRESGVRGEAAVRKALHQLENLGLVRREYRFGTSTMYWFSPPSYNENVARELKESRHFPPRGGR